VVVSHLLYNIYLLIVKVIQQLLLQSVVLLDCSWIFFLELAFHIDYFSHKLDQLVISFIVGVCRMVRNDFLFLCSQNGSVDAVDCESLTGRLCGTNTAIIHVFVFNVDYVFCFFTFVILVGAKVFSRSFSVLLGSHSLRRIAWCSNIPRRSSWANHRFPCITDCVGRAE